MEASHLPSPALAPASDTSSNGTDDTLSLSAVVRAKVMAGRASRKKSWFEPDKCEKDTGFSIVSHADFPTSSLSKVLSKAEQSEELGFDKELIYEILEHEVKRQLESRIYDSAECEGICMQLADAVKEKVWALKIKNFKIVCTFFISKRTKPSMKMDSGCAWDELVATVDKDSFVDYVFQNDSISAVGTVYGICCERARQMPGRGSSFTLLKRTRASSFN